MVILTSLQKNDDLEALISSENDDTPISVHVEKGCLSKYASCLPIFVQSSSRDSLDFYFSLNNNQYELRV